MSGSRRGRLAPPDLPGYTYLRQLGSGGFSDVYLYRQRMPSRDVAVKVLLQGAMRDTGNQHFADEANVTASLASHPSIVTIHHADIAGDGRPYLVMEYYPSENLRVRAQRERLSVATVLSYGVQIACAVETAHRAGILHRDIKPANILVNSFNIPGLADFGIAATVAEAASEADDAAGLSIPWSPPEVLRSARMSDERSDVYSLGATLYTLLTGRSPFEVPHGRNGSQDLMRRIETEAPQPLARADVPQSVERLLLQAMSKAPAARPPSALVLAQALQGVESELGLPVTPLVIMQQPRPMERDPDAAGEDAATRRRPAGRVLEAQGPAAGATSARAGGSTAGGSTAGGSTTGGSTTAAAEGTVLRSGSGGPVVPDDATRRHPPAPPLADPRNEATKVLDTRLTGRTAPEPAAPHPFPVFSPPAEPAHPSPAPVVPPRTGAPDRPALEETSRRPPSVPDASGDGAAGDGAAGPTSRTRLVLWLAAAVLVVGGTSVGVALAIQDDAKQGTASNGDPGSTGDLGDPGDTDPDAGSALIVRPPAVEDLALKPAGSGTYRVSWTNPEPAPDDRYHWRRNEPGAVDTSTDFTTKTSLVLRDVPPDVRPCVEVVVVRGDEPSEPRSACATT